MTAAKTPSPRPHKSPVMAQAASSQPDILEGDLAQEAAMEPALPAHPRPRSDVSLPYSLLWFSCAPDAPGTWRGVTA